MNNIHKVPIWAAPTLALAAGLALATPGTAAAAAAAARSAYPTFAGQLYDVTAISARDAWAVGSSPAGSLIVHWDGTTWSRSLSSPGSFSSVAASSARDVWAVGENGSQALAWHWDGRHWKRVPTPTLANGGGLHGVAVTSPGNAWAVGRIEPAPGTYTTTPLIEHWDGKRWSIQQYPAPPDGGFAGVAATSPRNAWAVGGTGDIHHLFGAPLIEHWDGKRWSRVPSPNPPGNLNASLGGVTVISGHDAWAVGAADYGRYGQTVAMHWDGRQWKLASSPAFVGGGFFAGVAASGANNIWAVGQVGANVPNPAPLIEHRTCMHWTQFPGPAPQGDDRNALFSVSVASSTDVWAVGTVNGTSTLIVHWNGRSWS